jgi:hypothetical protein
MCAQPPHSVLTHWLERGDLPRLGGDIVHQNTTSDLVAELVVELQTVIMVSLQTHDIVQQCVQQRG